MEDVSVVEDFHESASSEDDESPPKRRRQGPNRVRVKMEVFQSYDEAEKYVYPGGQILAVGPEEEKRTAE